MIEKCHNPTSKDDMRNLGLSPFLSKGLEQVLVEWLLPYVAPFLSKDQLGGRKKCSANHYLARLVQYLYEELDNGNDRDRRGVAAMAVDLAKAFNRLDHAKLLTLFFDLGVPPCALRLLKSYLNGRTMRVHLSDAISTVYELWGGGPQGGLLTVLLFNVNSNWITDICQPGIRQSARFLPNRPVFALRCAAAQQRDCPPDRRGELAHVCPFIDKCASSLPHRAAISIVLRPEAPTFLPAAVLLSNLNPEAVTFFPGATSQDLIEYRGSICDRSTSLVASGSSPLGDCDSVASSPVQSVVPLQRSLGRSPEFCSPILDLNGLCHCLSQENSPHVAYLPVPAGFAYPPCRNDSLRLLYIDDSLVAVPLYLDRCCVKLLPTYGPYGRMLSCGLGIPGAWNPLEHRLRDIHLNAEAIGMVLNTRKTKLICFNPTENRQCVPFASLHDGEPLQCVEELRLLGLVLDEQLTWWPFVADVKKRTNARIWSLVKLREAGASPKQLSDVYVARIRGVIEYGAQVYGCVLNKSQSQAIEAIQARCLQIVLGKQSRSYRANLALLDLPRLDDRRLQLMRSFAISAYRSVHHRWWFTPNKPSQAHTRSAPPRFVIPLLRLRRSQNRPFQRYAELLNAISPGEWELLRLDQICHARSRPNV